MIKESCLTDISYLSHLCGTGAHRELKSSAELREKAPRAEPLMTNSVPKFTTAAVRETDDLGLSYIRIFPH